MPRHAHHTAPSADDALHGQAFWDERYASADSIWSGLPNRRLVEQTTDLAPGSALEIGCGEGADALWLAQQGWDVLAVDISPVALTRAAAHAGSAAPDAAQRISWAPLDVLHWDTEWDGDPHRDQVTFDLVSAQFLHLEAPDLAVLVGRLARIVRPGGTLLIVGHHPDHLATVDHPHGHLMFDERQVSAALDGDRWEIVVATAQTREIDGPDGDPVTFTDTVVRAVRRP